MNTPTLPASAREDALREVAAIAARHQLTLKEITEALKPDAKDKGRGDILMRLFSYLGGIFVISGICAYIGMFWEHMNSATRILVTLGSGIACYIMALICDTDARYERAVTPLFLITAILLPTGMLVAIDELFHSGSDWRYATLLTAITLTIQQGLTFWGKRRAVLLFTTIFFGAAAVGNIFDLMDIDESFIAIIIGTSLLCLSYGITKTPWQSICSFWNFVGSASLLFGIFDLVEHTAFEALFIAATAMTIYLSTVMRSRSLLFTGTIGLLSYIAYFTEEHFVNSIGWPIALVLLGIAFFGVGALSLRLKRRFISTWNPICHARP